jgi:uncharacterized membrane protein YedE/YeeE
VIRALVAALAGAMFGAGLLLSGMTRPEKVLGFLDVTGRWDPTLAFVMVGAIGVHAIAYRLIRRRPSPLLDARFHWPPAGAIDRRLLAGAAVFGAGWGLAGFCPGPGLVAAATGATSALVFAAGLLAGMLAHAAAPGPRLSQ